MVGLHSLLGLTRRRGVRTWLGLSLVVGGLAFGLLSLTAFFPHPAWGVYAIWVLGVCRGLYNVGLSHLTMRLAHPAFSGIFMGLWNLASGLALAGGEMVGGLLKDTLVPLAGGASGAYGGVFLLEGVGLLACLIFLAPLRRDEYHQHLAGLLAAPSLAASGDGSAGQGQGGSP
jgi:MFS family permease